MPLAEHTGALGVKRAAHLLRRATFGATKSDIDRVALLTPNQAIAELFRQPLPTPQPPIDPKTGTEWMSTGTTSANSEDFVLEALLVGWIVGQGIGAGVNDEQALAYSAREKMMFFLHTHFTTIKSKVSSTRALYFQRELFRLFALDDSNANPELDTNIKELTVRVSIDNAMLRLLDGNLNVRGNPNENYARELLELYTIGRGLEGSLPPIETPGDYYVFTEADVQAAARVLSGWDFDRTFATIDEETLLPRGKVKGSPLNASTHDNLPKTFSDRFQNRVIQPDPLLLSGGNATEESALDEIRQLIDMIYERPETAKNICWKIYRFFVYAPHDRYQPGNIVARIDSEIITPMAEYLVQGGFKIQPVIENLLKSRHFFDAGSSDFTDDNFGGIIKSPLDLVTGTLRAFNIRMPDPVADAPNFYEAARELVSVVEGLGMHLYEPFDVAGYDAYHQFPIYHRFWITPNTLARRYDFIRSILMNENEMFMVNLPEYVRDNFTAAAPNANNLIREIALYFFPVADNLSFDDDSDDNAGLTYKRLNYFKERFLQDFDDEYWTSNWNRSGREVEPWLQILFNAMLQSPENQLA